MVVAAVVATVFTVTWIWNKAEALSPVDLPSANGTPLETIDPSVKPTRTPPPNGKYVDGNLVAWNNDRMPGMPVPTWEELPDVGRTGLYGGHSMWMVVHDNYDGPKDWGNLVAFGGLGKGIPYNSTPAGLKLASRYVASRLATHLYRDNPVPIKGSVKHRPLTVGGHRAHELIARIPIKEPKLKQETNSIIAVVVIDRGDGTAMVSIGDFAGTTTGWFLYWRNQVQKIQINR